MLDEMKADDTGFIAGCSNELFLNLPPEQVNIIVKNDGTVVFRDPNVEKICGLTNADKRFIEELYRVSNRPEQDASAYEGSDSWYRDRFKAYFAGLLTAVAKIPNVFEEHPKSMALPPQVSDYGNLFVLDFLQTGCVARWIHMVDQDYAKNLKLAHPSGPPADTMDQWADQAAQTYVKASSDLHDLKEKAKKSFSRFFEREEVKVEDKEIKEDSKEEEKNEEQEVEEEEDVISSVKKWWKSF